MGDQLRKSVRAIGACATWVGLVAMTAALWAGMYWTIFYRATYLAS